ncbi:MAG TPA: redox-sensing transcriptional repressor Rex [Candidatus Omnitrophota bacterium]|nr:redox-sensing transcriptional repressor Rex [Candidatus Omnitrophota bacterium]HPS20083.1 redox-sensing transcriptional repressor Rex [Candidatus Omnitrophota bacterium]
MNDGINRNDGVIKIIPEPTLRRLPLYYQYLNKTAQNDVNGFISCTQIANDLGFVPVQVRKDIEMTGAVGRPKVGYNVGELAKAIEHFLGWNNTSDAFLIGAGHLGLALLGYPGFKDYGVNIVAAFDTDPNKVGKEIRGRKIFHIKKLPEMTKRLNIRLGILTVPGAYVQEIADMMVQAGIRGIWNFAPVKVTVKENVIVQHENLASSLAVLSKRLATALEAKKE